MQLQGLGLEANCGLGLGFGLVGPGLGLDLGVVGIITWSRCHRSSSWFSCLEACRDLLGYLYTAISGVRGVTPSSDLYRSFSIY